MAYTQQIPVRFADLDALNHVNHATILSYAETVRCDWFLDVLGHASMAELPFIIASIHCEYDAPIPKTAALEVELTVGRIGTKSWTFEYKLYDRQSGLVYARVSTTQVAYDYARAATVAIDAQTRDHLESLLAVPA